jgi:hypothetical protein
MICEKTSIIECVYNIQMLYKEDNRTVDQTIESIVTFTTYVILHICMLKTH